MVRNTVRLAVWAAAGSAVAAPLLCRAQVLTPPNGVAQAQAWAYAPSYTQQVTGTSGSVTQFQLIIAAGEATGGAWHSDAVVELISPNNTVLLIGGDSAGGYPGAVAWNSLPYTGVLPPGSGSATAINATFTYAFGPAEGTWSFNFRNQWTDGAIPWNNIQIVLITDVDGACCLLDGSCSVMTSAACAQAGGIYQGDNTDCSTITCPQPSACCLPNGLCAMMFEAPCTAAAGIFNAGADCATFTCPIPPGLWAEQGDAGQVPAQAQVTLGMDPLLLVRGVITGAGDVDMYRIKICDPESFIATTVQGANWDTQLFLFDASGLGICSNDDAVGTTSIQSRLTDQFIPGAGEYYLAISAYNRDPLSGGSSLIFDPAMPRSEVPANGPGAGAPVDSWTQMPATTGEYEILLTGACFAEPAAPACYANCDGSTAEPILNVADFGCFLQHFAAGDPYANCDGSTTEPVLNVADFGCFLQEFASGCR